MWTSSRRSRSSQASPTLTYNSWLAKWTRSRIPAGTVLITEGAGNNVFFVILEGVVDVSVGGKYRRTLGPHDFFGEISMMELDPATATVASRTPVRAFVMSHAQFSAVKAHETIMLQLKAARSQRLHADRKIKE